MIGLSFAAVPLYRMFCAATGFAGTPQRADAASRTILPQTVTMRFDATTSPGLNWSFQPVERQVTLHIGENKLAFYRATNLSNETLTGTATFNVSPDTMGAYFTKVQCFCFKEQTLAPGETVDMAVSFFIGPEAIEDKDTKDVHDVTLSYTFFRAANASPSSQRADLPSGRRG